MPQSLVHEFLDQRASGNKLGSSLKNAIFQAKSPDLEVGEVEDVEPKFQLWKVQMRGLTDDNPVDWWFASTGIPILAATLGPLANVLSIGALVTSWRMDLRDPNDPDGPLLTILEGAYFKDSSWCLGINAASLVLGFVGNIFLLLNFTQKVRYLISLPLTIILWFIACGMLIGDLAAVKVYNAPISPYQTFTGGYWHGIAAACMYLLLAVMLAANMLGYIRGHYPQHFYLTEEQRTLIVQTMMFFLYLAGGAGIFARVEGWNYDDALYFCDVTILTVGFGDLFPLTTVGRAFLIPYSVGGIITLGLVIGAIFKSVQEIGEKNIIRHHFEQQRERAKGKTARSSLELHRRQIEMEVEAERAMAKHASKHAARAGARSTGTAKQYNAVLSRTNSFGISANVRPDSLSGLSRQNTILQKHKQIKVLREEKDRFNAMRTIQKKSDLWRDWYRLTVSVTVFGSLWCIGAVFFWVAERGFTGQTYWETIYFSWVALLSIGFGDFSPKTGAGRCFFIIWSLLAVPSMTILAGDLSNTVVSFFTHWSNAVAKLTVLPEIGLWGKFTDRYSWLFCFLPTRLKNQTTKKDSEREEQANTTEKDYIQDANSINDKDESFAAGTKKVDLVDLVDQHERDIKRQPDASALARQLALAIRRTAHDLMMETPRAYSYEEWAEFTRLIRFSAVGGANTGLQEEAEEGMIEWDWIGEDSPMMQQGTETQFVLERLVESLVRYLKRNPPHKEFVESLKDKGEDALKMKGGAAPHEDEDEILLSGGASGYTADSRSLRSWNGVSPSQERTGMASVRDLHPLEEHEDEHITPAPHR